MDGAPPRTALRLSYYKLRVGDYRAILSWDREDDVIYVEAVGHRRNVYDRHLPP